MKNFDRFLVSLLVVAVCGLVVASGSVATAETNSTDDEPFRPGLMRIDFSLTTAVPTNWDGEIRLSRGSFANLVPLGTDPTGATTFFFDDPAQTRIGLQTVAPTAFCGFEATLFSPRDARIELKLRDRTTEKTIEKTVFVERLIDSSTRVPFNDSNDGALIVRAPADELPVRIERVGAGANRRGASTVFQPGETFRVSVLPRSSATRLTDELTLTATATARDEKSVLWSEARDLSLAEIRRNDALVGDPGATPTACVFELRAPETEGVFNLTLELAPKTKAAKPTFALAPTTKRTAERPIARRVVQGVVVPRNDDANVADANDADWRGELLETIDPTNPSWRKIFSKRSFFPNFLKTTGPNDGKSAARSSDRRVPQTFADDATSDDATVLGQESTLATKNLFGFVFPQRSNLSRTPEAEAAERAEIVRRWTLNRFQTFYPPIDRRAWGLTADLWDKPLSGGNSSVLDASEISRFAAAQTGFVRLDPNGTPRRNAEPSSKTAPETTLDPTSRVSWEAYPIPIREPGKAHLLEIEYPSNVPQKLGIAALEPSPSGGLFSTSLDVGLVVGDDALDDRADGDVSRFTVLFWPKTKAPTILLTNRSSKTAAFFGQIRVYRADVDRPTPPKPGRGRLFGVAMTKPTLCDRFSAVRKASPFGVLGSEDWTTFDDATSRTLEYLSAASFDSAILAVAADGTALYPSELLAPTPRCDGGVFLPTGGDPTRKDVLELALAKFDANRSTLIPLLDLNSPLPALEAKLRAIHSGAVSDEERAKLEGIESIGPDGRLLVETRQANDGTGPYYNPLHPEVQRAVLAIVGELTARCGSRESFGGVALDVGAGGWLALPDDVYYGMDDETIGRFVRESNLSATLAKKGDRRVQELLFAQGPERYRFRAEFVRDVCLDEWLNWRCDALRRFYREICDAVVATRPDARLYLVATNALDGPVCRALLYPTLRQTSKLKDAFRLVGLDPALFADDASIVFLRPEIVATTSDLATTATASEFETPDAAALFASDRNASGALFYHRAEKLPLPEFDAASPYRPTILELETRALPADFENRRRFARRLASADSLCMFDGGDVAPSGQEETLRDWIDAFRRLPAVPFATWRPKSSGELDKTVGIGTGAGADAANSAEKSIQPLVVRYVRNEKETWVYLVNAAPFHVGVELAMKIRAGATFETFAGSRPDKPLCAADDLVWNFTATPFDLVALRVADPKATVESVDVSRPDEICGPNGRLPNEIRKFVDRILTARSGVALSLRNGDFEESFAPRPLDADVEKVATSAESAGPLGLELPKMNLFKKSTAPPTETPDAAPTATPFDPNSIPGWRAFGPENVVVRLDENVVRDGRASLRLSSTRDAGGVLSQPFEPPTTGRLCVQISFGVPVDARSVPLRVCLTGRRDGKPYLRRLVVGPTILERARKQGPANDGDSIVWVRDVVLFDRLPLDGLERTSLRFDLLGPGDVWIDDVRLYKLAFADAEQNELMRVVSVAEFRVSKDRVLDSLNLLDGYWARLLKEQIPDDSPELAARRRQTAVVAAVPEDAREPAAEKSDKPKNRIDRAFQRLKFW